MELSINDLRQLIGRGDSEITLGLQLGMQVVIRTVTYHYTGLVVDILDGVIILDRAGWLADSGKWSEFLITGRASEVEMYPTNVRVHVAIATVVDWCELEQLPEETR